MGSDIRFLVCHVMQCRSLHCVAMFKSKIFHRHVNMSGIVFVQRSSLSVDHMTDDFCFCSDTLQFGSGDLEADLSAP